MHKIMHFKLRTKIMHKISSKTAYKSIHIKTDLQ